MYPTLFLLALSPIHGALTQAPVWENEYRRAYQLSREQQKPLAVFVANGASGWDALTPEGRLSDDVRSVLKQNYVCYYVDAQHPEGRKVADQFKVEQVPSLILSDRTGVYIALRQKGALDNERLAQVLRSNTTVVVPPVQAPPVSSRPVPYQIIGGSSSYADPYCRT
jgi:hypothetical protein